MHVKLLVSESYEVWPESNRIGAAPNHISEAYRWGVANGYLDHYISSIFWKSEIHTPTFDTAIIMIELWNKITAPQTPISEYYHGKCINHSQRSIVDHTELLRVINLVNIMLLGVGASEKAATPAVWFCKRTA